MPRQGRLENDLGRTPIPNLTHHQHVRIVSQQRLQPADVIEPHGRPDFRLSDRRQHRFHRIFQRQQDLLFGEMTQQIP